MSLTERSRTAATHSSLLRGSAVPPPETETPPQAGVVLVGLAAALMLGGVIFLRSGQVPGDPVRARPGAGLRAVPQPVRLHLRVAAAGRRAPGRLVARPHADAGRGLHAVRTDPRHPGVVRRAARDAHAGADRRRAVRRLVPVRHRHAARRVLRLRHPVRHRQRPVGDPADARRLHHRRHRRRAPLPVVDQRAPEPGAGLVRRPDRQLHRRLAALADDHGRRRRADLRRRPPRPGPRPRPRAGGAAAWPGPSAARGRCGSARCCSPGSTRSRSGSRAAPGA